MSMCSVRVTYCPFCRQPLSQAECDECPDDEYPTHYACRVYMQQCDEAMDAGEELPPPPRPAFTTTNRRTNDVR